MDAAIDIRPIKNGEYIYKANLDEIHNGNVYYAIDLYKNGKYEKQVGKLIIYSDGYAYAESKPQGEFLCEANDATGIFPEFVRLHMELS